MLRSVFQFSSDYYPLNEGMKKQNKTKQEKKKKEKEYAQWHLMLNQNTRAQFEWTCQSIWTERNNWKRGLEMCHAPLIYLQASMNQYYSLP